MKRVVLFPLILFLMVGLAYAKDYEIKKKAGDYEVEVKIDRNPPIAGANNVEIAIKDTAGKQVSDAKVTVAYSMPAMPGMPAMNYKTDAAPAGEKYKATMNLSMAGSWNVEIRIARGGKSTTAKFSIDAR